MRRVVQAVSFAMSLIGPTLGAQTTQQPPSAKDTAAVRVFAQAFYDWYTSKSTTPTGSSVFWAALSRQPSVLTIELRNALRGDSIAIMDTAQNRETLDADPFLNSQDPCPRYVVQDVRLGKRDFVADVYGVCRPEPRSLGTVPSVVAHIRRNGSRFEFVDVEMGERTLLGWLCSYAKADLRPEKRPRTC